MWTHSADDVMTEEGLFVIEAEFFTEQFVIRGEIISPELRLSDHLNSSTMTLELRPSSVQRSANGLRVNMAGRSAFLSKAHLLFVLPMVEPGAGSGAENLDWMSTVTQTCLAGLGRYSLLGKLHMEAGRNPRLFLRSLEQRQFLPFTDVRLTLPDGSVRDYPAAVVNRLQMELLALRDEPGS